MDGGDEAPIHSARATVRLLHIAYGPGEIHLRRVFRREPSARWKAADSPCIVRPKD